MAEVVVIGAGLGGLPAAYELRHHLGRRHRVTLVSEFPRFTFVPGLVAVSLGHLALERVQLDLAGLAQRHGLQWVPGKVQALDPVARRIALADRELSYDYLVIATGAELAFDALPGLGVYSHSICNPAHALKARQAWEAFLRQPGDLLVGAAPGAGCFGPAYEFVLLAEADLRRRGLRERVAITYVTPEPYVGHLGVGGLAQARELTEALMHRRGIRTITNARIEAVTPDRVRLADGRSLPFGYSMILPALRGAAFVRAAGLGNEKGFLPLLPTLQHPRYPEIYGVGVSVHLEQPERTPVPIGLPKSGQMTEAMAMVAAHNMAVQLGVKPAPWRIPTLEALCFAEYGDTGIAYIAAPVLPDPGSGQRRYAYAVQGMWVNWAKAAFEHYFLAKMRLGWGIPWFEQWGLRLLFGLALAQPLASPLEVTDHEHSPGSHLHPSGF
ncbi:MAG: FAD-dependent oxidoreductase [Gloeomargarita sp. DG_1_4_bins_134]